MFLIIIVNYNAGNLLETCVRSIIDSISVDYEIVIVDNASTDNSLDFLESDPTTKRIRVIRSQENLGYAAALNLGAQQGRGKFLHFLNPDIVVDKSLDEAYGQVSRSNKRCIYVTRLLDPDGREQKIRSMLPFVKNYVKMAFLRKDVSYYYVGASVIIRRDLFEEIGGWPTDYFMYCEDVDLFYSAHRKGIPSEVLNTSLIHLGGGTTRNVWDRFEASVRMEFSNIRFHTKYGTLVQHYVILPIILARLVFFRPRRVPYYTKVWWTAFRRWRRFTDASWVRPSRVDHTVGSPKS